MESDYIGYLQTFLVIIGVLGASWSSFVMGRIYEIKKTNEFLKEIREKMKNFND